MCGQCAFLKEKYYKEGNGGGKEYYCEYLKEYVCGSCRGCSNYQKDEKRSNDKVNTIINDGKTYDNGIPVEMYFLLLLILVILGLILGVFQ